MRYSSPAFASAHSSTPSQRPLAYRFFLGGTSGEILDLDYLSSRGVRIALQGHQPFMAAVNAVHETLKALREGTPPDDLSGVASGDLMKRVTRGGDYHRWIDKFLGED